MKSDAFFLNKLAILTLISGVVACGGGSADQGSALMPYLGKWGSCNGAGQMEWLLVNPGSDEGELLLEVETSFHTNADCSGSPGAYLIHSGASIVAEKFAKVDVALGSGSTVRSIQADAFNTSTSAGTLRVLSNGMRVDYLRLNNEPGSWCINGVAGKEYCFQEDDEYLIEGQDQIGFLREADKLYGFNKMDGTYKLTATYHRY
jgi:hypothetical protein